MKRVMNWSVLAVIVVATSAIARGQQPAAPSAAAPATPGAAAPAAAEKPAELPPLPPDAHVAQSIQLGGRTLSYTATVGTIAVYGSDNKKTGKSCTRRTRWKAPAGR